MDQAKGWLWGQVCTEPCAHEEHDAMREERGGACGCSIEGVVAVMQLVREAEVRAPGPQGACGEFCISSQERWEAKKIWVGGATYQMFSLDWQNDGWGPRKEDSHVLALPARAGFWGLLCSTLFPKVLLPALGQAPFLITGNLDSGTTRVICIP